MADATPANSEMQKDAVAAQAARAATRRTWLIRLVIAVVVIAVLWALYYVVFVRGRISTDNAYVNAEVAQVTPLLSAQAIAVNVRDTQTVRAGDILVKLDPANAKIGVEQAEARRKFRQTVATSGALSSQVQARGADIAQARARLTTAQAELEKARVELDRRAKLKTSGAVSGEEVTTAQTAFAGARAAVAEAQAAVAQAQSTRSAAVGNLAANDTLVRGLSEDSDPGVLAAKAKLDMAKLDLDRTVIRAPIAGVVSKRQVQIGQRVAQGTPIMTIVPLTSMYVEANFKERQLRGVRIGMPATVTADLYGGSVVYHGRVAGLSGGTGSSQSLIPAQNATGNWIKVVQRLPVRIELDPRELAQHPLRVGLSTEVEIDVSGA